VLRVPVKYRVRPAQVTIRTGDAVEWRNDTSHTQLIIADPRKAVDAERVDLPNGTQPFDSGEIVPGDRFRHTFDVPGTYVYVCRMRGGEGVAGIVVVKNDGAPGTISGVPGPMPPERSSAWQHFTPRTAPLFADNQYRTAGNGSHRRPVLTAGTDH
jgi:plastocyanin